MLGTISILYQAHLCMETFIPFIFTCNVSLIFLKRSLVFPILLFSFIYLHWLLRKAFLSLLAILWNSAFRCLYLSFSPLLSTSLLFTAMCKPSSDSNFAFLHFFFLGMVLFPVSCTMSQMWELNYEESWALKNWWFWTVMLEKTLESSLDYKEIKPVNPKGNQSWVFIGRTDAEAETPILWTPDAKSWLIWKDPDAGKDWGQEKEVTEDEMVGWHQWLKGHEFG